MSEPSGELIWGVLMHLSFNMWADRPAEDAPHEHNWARDYLRFDQELWDDLLQEMVDQGANMVVIDLGDGVRYESHPEIAVENAWTVDKLRAELARLREMGLEPIPKLNFSTTHDAWLGPYARMVSSEPYYTVCADLIAEVIELFDTPRFFHLGMDEETIQHHRRHAYVVIRQYELWWEDLEFYFEHVERGGSRPWVWSDYAWHHPERFWARMPQDVVQSNWYYRPAFAPDLERVKTYIELDQNGYQQIPTGSNWSVADNMQRTVAFCREHVSREGLLGFLQTSWVPTLEDFRETHVQALQALGEARSIWEG